MTRSKNSASNGERKSWDEYFYEMAKLVATRSRDDSKVGAVIVGEEHVVVATGYNGLPRKVNDLDKRIEAVEKYKWTVHAESNAICNAARVGVSTKNSTIYVTKFPCSACAGKLVQAGITRVVNYDSAMWKKDPSGDNGSSSLRILMESGVEIHAPYINMGEIITSEPNIRMVLMAVKE